MLLRLDEKASRARWIGLKGQIWPAGRSLETPGLDEPHSHFATLKTSAVMRQFRKQASAERLAAHWAAQCWRC